MGRNRLYATDAERQAAYRARNATTAPLRASPGKRPPSRPARLAAIQRTLQELLDEYERWLERLPESLQDTDQAERLKETITLLEEAAPTTLSCHADLGETEASHHR